MALSVRVGGQKSDDEEPTKSDVGAALPEVQHYLILTTKGLDIEEDSEGGDEGQAKKKKKDQASRMKLECSDHVFDNVLSLIYHYCALRWVSITLLKGLSVPSTGKFDEGSFVGKVEFGHVRTRAIWKCYRMGMMDAESNDHTSTVVRLIWAKMSVLPAHI